MNQIYTRMSLLFLLLLFFWAACGTPNSPCKESCKNGQICIAGTCKMPTEVKESHEENKQVDGGDNKEQNPPKKVEATKGVAVSFDTDGKWKTVKTFFNFPMPSDLRLNAKGGPDMTGFPNDDDNDKITNVLTVAGNRKGFPVIPVGYFRFSAALPQHDLKTPFLATKEAPILLIDIDENSPDIGKLYPTTASFLEKGVYVTHHILAVAIYPGIVLPAGRKYAFVVMRHYKDTKGQLLGVPKALNQLKAGETPTGSQGKKLKSLYDSLWSTLKKIQVKPEDVAAATVFTTGDTVAETARISNALIEQFKPDIKGLKLDSDDGDHDRYCELWGTIVQPQFQTGTPPFPKDGLFVLDDKGIPKKQRDKELPVVITIPKKPMPKDGYPLMLYIHGSGGYTSQVVDRGPQLVRKGPTKKGEGPAHVVAPFGIGAAGSAMPVNPERVKNASDFAYLNLNNLKAFGDTFRQGVIESRILLSSLLRLRISKSALGSCKGPTLPAGETAFYFSKKRPSIMGHSMGAMYTNMIAAVEPRLKALVASGAGGFWSFFALHSNVAILNEKLLRRVLSAQETLTFVHPVMHMLQSTWEAGDPVVYLPRISRRPLPNHPVRHVYQPIGQKDSYFPEIILDIMALAYGNQQAGDTIWKETQERLSVTGLDGLAKYPVKANRTSVLDKKQAYTGVAVQYKPDATTQDGHQLSFQLDDVKYQYSCFLASFIKSGTPIVPAPKALGTPCPE